MLNKSDDDVDFLFKEEMMRRGFHYLSEHSQEFKVEIKNLRKNIAAISETTPIEKKKLETISAFVNRRLDNSVQYMQKSADYVKQNLASLDVKDAELLLSELFYRSQVYFIYNETFTYGAIEPILVREIESRRLDLQDTLTRLSSYKGTAISALYHILLNVKAPSTLKEFLQKYKTDKVFTKRIDTLLERSSQYLQKDTTLRELFEMIAGVREHAANMRNAESGEAIDKNLVDLYLFVVDIQRKLYNLYNLYIRIIDMIFKKFKSLEKRYGGRKPKKHLLEIYFKNLDEIRKHKLSEPHVYYKNTIFNLIEKSMTKP